MSNKQLLLAYSTSKPMSRREIEARLTNAERHLAKIVRTPLTALSDCRATNGIIGWWPEDDKLNWPTVSTADQRTAGWLHVPPNPSKEDRPLDPITLAFDITHGKIERWAAGAPFACITLSPSGELRVANDVFGLARLYRYEFDEMTVWSSRQGLAHVFAGEYPRLNRMAWHSMATLGWPIQGTTLMGDGEQLPGLTLDRADPQGVRRSTQTLMDWLSDYSSRQAPSMVDTALSLQDVLRSTSQWPSPAVADLTGGKDSRVIAAAAITSGVTDTVRTKLTDYGEVETAKTLVETSPTPITHLIQEVTPPSLAAGGVENRLLSQQRIWEGHYLAKSAYKMGVNHGISGTKQAKLNGLGGEAIQGGEFMGGRWRERIAEGGQRAALDRLSRLVTNPKATSPQAQEITISRFVTYADRVRDLGWEHPEAPINFMYNTDRMPHWSLPFGDRASVVPFYAPAMLLHMARATREPQDYGSIHREILRPLIPAWSEVPFYKPSPKTRATTFMWEYEDWGEATSLIRERGEQSESFSPGPVSDLLHEINNGDGATAHENALVRLLWEISYHQYIQEVAADVDETKLKISVALKER